MRGRGSQHHRFEETQHFRKTWLWTLIAVTTGFVWYRLFDMIPLPFTQGAAMFSYGEALALIAAGIFLPLLFFLMKLHVTVSEKELRVHFSPFYTRKILLTEIEHVVACTYRPIVEYGGWGIRFRAGKGAAYSVGGNRGVRLKLRNNKKVLIGSEHPDSLADAIRQGSPAIPSLR